MLKVEIPQAHGEAIAARMQLMQQVFAQFNVLRNEDKRHVDAVLKTLAHDPDAFDNYNLLVEKEHYYLQLQPKVHAAQPQADTSPVVVAVQPVNGAVQPTTS